jgi:hypothetical protein
LKECRYLVINLAIVSWGVALVPIGVVLECPDGFVGCRIAGSRSHPSFLSNRRLFKLIFGEVRGRIKEFRRGRSFPFTSFCDPGNLVHLCGIFCQRIEFQGPFTVRTESPKAELSKLFKELVSPELAPAIKPALGMS